MPLFYSKKETRQKKQRMISVLPLGLQVPSPPVASIQTPALTLAVLRTASALKIQLTNRRGPCPVTAGALNLWVLM